MSRYNLWALVFLNLLAACGGGSGRSGYYSGYESRKRSDPEKADLAGTYPALTAAELSEVNKRRDEDSIVSDDEAASAYFSWGSGSARNQVASEFEKTFDEGLQKNAWSEIDLSDATPPVRNQADLPLCQTFSVADTVAGALFKTGESFSVYDLLRFMSPDSKTLSFCPNPNQLFWLLSKGATILDERSFPYDPDLLNRKSDLTWDMESNFLNIGRFFFKKFVTKKYTMTAQAIRKHSPDPDDENSSDSMSYDNFKKIEIDTDELTQINPAVSRSLTVNPFKLVDVAYKIAATRTPRAQLMFDSAIRHFQRALFEHRSPIYLGLCGNDLDKTVKSYKRKNITQVAGSGCGGHAVVVVGVKKLSGKTYIKIKNSWSPWFGARGYALLSLKNFIRVMSPTTYTDGASKGEVDFDFTYVDQKRPEHLLLSTSKWYKGALGARMLPHGYGTLYSNLGGTAEGYFNKGSCADCLTKSFIPESEPLILMNRAGTSFKHTGGPWSNLNPKPQAGDLVLVGNDRKKNAHQITGVRDDGGILYYPDQVHSQVEVEE